MSAIQQGKSLARQGRQWTEHMRDGIITGAETNVGAQGGAVAAQLPKRFTAYSSRDDIVQMKQQLMRPDGMSDFGRVYASDADFKWLQDKQAAAEAVNQDAWFNENYNKNDLASRQFAQEINPGFYSERERELMERTDMILRLKKIQLRGPQSEEDVRLLFLLNTGRVVLPDDWDRIGANWSAGEANPAAANQKQFQGGLIRMPLFTTQSQRTANATDAVAKHRPFATNPSPTGFFSWGDNPINGRMVTPANGNTFSNQVLTDLRSQ